MVHYYCTCSLNPNKERDTRNGKTPYRKVLTCAEGICNNCGHYTVATRDEVNPASGQLYNYITGYKQDIDNQKILRNTQRRDSYANCRNQ